MGYPQMVHIYKGAEHSIPFPMKGELMIAFYKKIGGSKSTFLGSLNIRLESLEHVGLKRVEFVENHLHTTLLSGILPLKSNEIISADITLEISWFEEYDCKHLLHQCFFLTLFFFCQ